jgi:molybdopterin/thiamine biosynthesis adenylyltransferase
MQLAKAGAENFILADPDTVEIANVPRQDFTLNQIGQNKAETTKENILKKNPYAKVLAIPSGISEINADEFVKRSTFVVDGIDVRAFDNVWDLHKSAKTYRKPTIVGYDLGFTAVVTVFRYDTDPNLMVLNGQVKEKDVILFKQIKQAFEQGQLSESAFMDFVYEVSKDTISIVHVPNEQILSVINREPDDNRIYQESTTSALLGSLSAKTAKEILAGRKVNNIVKVNLNQAVGSYKFNPFERLSLLLRGYFVVTTRSKRVQEIIQKIKTGTL